MTRVAIVIERFNLALGGAERSTYEIAQQLGKIEIGRASCRERV